MVSIPSQMGTLLGVALWADNDETLYKSQYPHRWALSWEYEPMPGRHGRMPGLNTLTDGHSLGSYEQHPKVIWVAGLNTLTDGHSLGSTVTTESYHSLKALVSIPSQMGTLLGGNCQGRRSVTRIVSIPSQMGTLLGVMGLFDKPKPSEVSIPSQMGTLLGDIWRQPHCSCILVSIPSQMGTLLGAGCKTRWSQVVWSSQYPHRWALSWEFYSSPTACARCRVSIPSQMGTLLGGTTRLIRRRRTGEVSIPSQMGTLLGVSGTYQPKAPLAFWSQYPHRWALSWEATIASISVRVICCLNTLTDGHSLGSRQNFT